MALINPEIVAGRRRERRGLGRLPEHPRHSRQGAARPPASSLRAFDRTGQADRAAWRRASPARVIQHETDHLDGVLFFDRMTSFETLTFMDEFRRYWAKGGTGRKNERRAPAVSEAEPLPPTSAAGSRRTSPISTARLRADQPARNRQGRAVRALLALAEVAAAAVPRRVRGQGRAGSARPRRRVGVGGRARRAALRDACSTTTATTRSRSSAACTSPCEDASNILTKVLERGRLMAYLEQSTRYMPYTDRRDGRWRYHVPAELDGHPLRDAVRRDDGRGVRDLRASGFDADAGVVRARGIRKPAADSDGGVSRRDPRQGARHAARHAAGRHAVERRASTAPARRTRRCCCACARIRWPKCAQCADEMLAELRKVIPAFLTRVDQPDRGGRWSAVPAPTRERARRASPRGSLPASTPSARDEVTLDGFRSGRRGEGRRRRALRRRRRCPTISCWRIARRMTADERAQVLRRVRRRSRRIAGTGPAARSSARLSLRRPHRLRRVPRSAAPSAADDRLAAADDAARLQRAGGDRRGRRPATTGGR